MFVEFLSYSLHIMAVKNRFTQLIRMWKTGIWKVKRRTKQIFRVVRFLSESAIRWGKAAVGHLSRKQPKVAPTPTSGSSVIDANGDID